MPELVARNTNNRELVSELLDKMIHAQEVGDGCTSQSCNVLHQENFAFEFSEVYIFPCDIFSLEVVDVESGHSFEVWFIVLVKDMSQSSLSWRSVM